ncbi:hypothetical protein KCP73_09035 [Salmonella enterica subsp. enterica]|nr:hypothetical protein KCP73_09035 [Salmonella enterica subsp. enterica]
MHQSRMYASGEVHVSYCFGTKLDVAVLQPLPPVSPARLHGRTTGRSASVR